MNRTPFVGRAVWMLLGAAGILLTGAAAEPAVAQSDRPNALKIGLLMDFSSGSTEAARDRQRAFDLAIKHVNDGGGVFGRAVSVAVGDTTANPETAVAVARRLVEVEGVHAIVGPNASANALLIAERVIGPAGVPTISFSATSPKPGFSIASDICDRVHLAGIPHVGTDPRGKACQNRSGLASRLLLTVGVGHVRDRGGWGPWRRPILGSTRHSRRTGPVIGQR